MDIQRRLEVVEAENEVLRERVADLERQLMETKPLPIEWRLTVSEARVFGLLANREIGTKDSIMSALYYGRGVDEANAKIVDVFICKLRKKLKPFGIAIQTIWGTGYCLDTATKRQFRAGATLLQAAE